MVQRSSGIVAASPPELVSPLDVSPLLESPPVPVEPVALLPSGTGEVPELDVPSAPLVLDANGSDEGSALHPSTMLATTKSDPVRMAADYTAVGWTPGDGELRPVVC